TSLPCGRSISPRLPEPVPLASTIASAASQSARRQISSCLICAPRRSLRGVPPARVPWPRSSWCCSRSAMTERSRAPTSSAASRRQVLQRLAHERVVTLMPNRGATVSKPSVREAHEVFAARQVLEAGTVARFIEAATRADCKRLHQHVTREQAAWRQGDRRASLKYSGEFHLIIAEVGGNRILMDMLRDLVSRSSLIIAAYQAPAPPCCPPDEHRGVPRALERRQS